MKTIKYPEILKDRLSNGMLLLPFIRLRIVARLNKDNVYKQKPISNMSRGGKINLLLLLKHIHKFKIKDAEILIFSSTLFNVKNKNGLYFNQLHGFYKEIFPDNTTIIEDADSSYKWNEPNIDDSISYVNTYLILIGKFLALILGVLNIYTNVNSTITEKYYGSIFSHKELVIRNCYYIVMYKLYKSFFKKRKKTKLVIVNTGCYGAERASLIKAAHECNLLVVEPQHGVINGNHYVYNHIENFVNESEEYKEYLPDYLLTFGKFWNENANINIKKYIVGNPFINQYMNKECNGSNILFISEPECFDVMLDLACKVKCQVNDQVIFRTHPLDCINNNHLRFFEKSGLIWHNYKDNLYEDILNAKVVIGLTSTCIFEAISLNKKVFVLDNEGTRSVFERCPIVFFKNIDELLKVLNTEIPTNTPYKSRDFYESGFEERYKFFIKQNNIITNI